MTKAKQETQDKPKEDPKEYFNYALINLELPILPPGTIQLTPIHFKFSNPGQIVIGRYMGFTNHTSAQYTDKTFNFHKIWMPTGVIVGFIGSVQLDDILCPLEANKYEVHIEYTSMKKSGSSKSLKVFDVMARLFEENRYAMLQDTDHKLDPETGEFS